MWNNGNWQQAHVQAMPHAQVDWATLAQQWIQTKDSSDKSFDNGSAVASDCVVPPGEDQPHHQPDGGGEASMELCDNGEENNTSGGWEGVSWNQNNWHSMNAWHTGAGGGSATDASSGYAGLSHSANWPGQGNGHTWQHDSGYEQYGQNQFGAGGNKATQDAAHFINEHYDGQANGFGKFDEGGDYSKRNNLLYSDRRHEIPALMDVHTDQGCGIASLNEDQRKKLPIWIREGLEKMERDKRKKEDEKIRKQRTLEKKLKQQKEQEEIASKDPTVSKFDREEFDSDAEEVNESSDKDLEKKAELRKNRKSRFEEVEIPKLEISVEPPKKSKEELLQEMSYNLRKILTTILMEVTNEEMTELCDDVLAKEKSRKGKPQLKSMLSGYGSNSESEEEEEDVESDNETQKLLKKKKSKFSRMEGAIQDSLDREEKKYKHRERKWLAGRDSSPDKQSSSHSTPIRNSSRSTSRNKTIRNKSPSKSVSRRRSRSRTHNEPKKGREKKERNKSGSTSKTASSRSNVRAKRRTSKSPDSKRRRSYSADSQSSRKRSRSLVRKSRSRDRRSRTRDQESRTRERGSRTRGRRSRSRARKSRSRDLRRSLSRFSKNRRSSSQDRRSRSRQGRERTRSRSTHNSGSQPRSPARRKRSKSREHKKVKKSKKSRRRSDS